MAWNKRKTLDAARKYAQKGAQDKALKEYARLLQSDPRDAKLRIEVGDTYRRWGRVDEAVETYTRVAEQYTQEGFDARAVAVYKQIQSLDPQRLAIYEPLADLYQRMGLASEAGNSLQTVAEAYQRAGKKREALGALRKLAALDPANTASRLKVADLLRQEQMLAEAGAEYGAVADELERQRDRDGLVRCLTRLVEIAPGRADALARLARCLLEAGRDAEAERFARRALDASPADPGLYELLADLYRRLGRTSDAAEVHRSLANLHRERGDIDRARDIMQRLVSVEGHEVDPGDTGEFSDARPEEALGVVDGDPSVFGQPAAFDAESGADGEALLLVEPNTEPEDLFVDDLGADGLLEDDDDDGATQFAAPSRRGPEPAPAAGASADLEQLLAEASVYLRYGKRRQAIENLAEILRRDPDHRPALEKLGEARVEAGENEAAIACWQRACELASAAGESSSAEVLRDRIRALGGSLPEPVSLPASRASAPPPVAFPPEPIAAPPGDPAAGEEEVYLELDEPAVAAEPSGAAASDPAGPLAFESEMPSLGDALSGVSALADDVEGAAPAPSPAAEARGRSASQSSSQQVLGDLEEADFYLQQGLIDEAEAIYQRLAKIAPNHPRVLVRLGEIAAARGGDPDATDPHESAAAPAAPLPLSEDSIEELIDGAHEIELDLEGEPGAGAAAAALESEARSAAAPALDGPEALAAALPEPAFELEATPEEELFPEVELEADDEGPAGDFDLAAVLSDALEEPDARAESAATRAGDTASEGFQAVFAAFKRGVRDALSDTDHEAHYDLGIAYREMGLYQDALHEFEQVAESASRAVDGLHMMGVCALDLGRPGDAVASLQRALAHAEIRREQELGVRFELGRGFEALGDVGRAREAWEAVVALDPLFCDVQERLVRLERGAKSEREPETRGADDTAELLGAAGYESFDDLMASMEVDEAVAAEPAAAPEPEPAAGEAAPAGAPPAPSEPDPSESSQNSKRRRRRIAFV